MKYYILCKQDDMPESQYRICIGINTGNILNWQKLDWLNNQYTPMVFSTFKAKELIEVQRALDKSPWYYWLKPAEVDQ